MKAYKNFKTKLGFKEFDTKCVILFFGTKKHPYVETKGNEGSQERGMKRSLKQRTFHGF